MSKAVTYDESHKRIIESGIGEIRKVLFGDDVYKIRQVLFCLDLYLDPFYKNRLPYEKEIFDLLQELVICNQDDDIIDDCLQLIGDYSCYPLTIMEKGFEGIKENKKSYARCVLEQP